ncbi:15919_t:CDS:1, partial [Gigaspora rosea]
NDLNKAKNINLYYYNTKLTWLYTHMDSGAQSKASKSQTSAGIQIEAS